MRRRANSRSSEFVNALGLTIAIAACAYALIVGTPEDLAHSAAESLAAASVSISAGVAPNAENTLAAELTEKERQLTAREDALTQREASVSSENPWGANALGLYSLIASIALFILVGLNFYFDRRRFKPGTVQRALMVDLRLR
jgi:hypothetical protein